ncbi:MAG: cytochrome c [Rhodospirillales bacterium]|jgi:hypothetical protein|nr:cytochrome c [Rhodospirillales bacterium]
MFVVWLGPIKHGNAAEDGQEIFISTCAGCHTIGQGVLVGPDLAGVTSRREESWLVRQITDPEGLIAEKDPIALQLLKEADDMAMPSPGLSDEEVLAVIAYFKSIEKQASVAVGLPSQYMPTVIIAIVLLLGLTMIGLKVGKKTVDPRPNEGIWKA